MPVVDPTENVKALVELEVKRLDDLRVMAAECQSEVANLRAEYDEKLRKAETARIDAIRLVDTGAVTRAAEVAAAQAQALATQVATSAETLRGQVAAAAAQGVIGLAAALDPIQKDIAELRKVQYEQQGQKAAQTETRADTRDTRGVTQWAVGFALSAFVAALAIAGLVAKLVAG